MSSKHRIRVKTKAVEYLGSRCVKCGYNKCIDALDFHHIDPTTKSFKLADAFHAIKGLSSKWEFIQPELDKCELVCRNCHAEYHYDDFEKQRVETSTRPKKVKHSAEFVGWPSVEDVLKLVEMLGYSGAGREIGVSDNGVRKYLKTHINTLPKINRSELMKRLHLENRL